MQNISYIAGVLFFIMSTIARWIGQNDHPTPWKFIRLFSIPAINNQDEFIAMTGQIMGVLWIGMGVIFSHFQEWFSSSTIGIIIELLFIVTPFLFGRLIVKLLIARNKNQEM